jgi:hypothetical protein
MIVIVGLIVLLVAVTVGSVGVLSNAGAEHTTENFSVLGYHVTGSTGTLFLFGIVVGAVGMLGLSVMLAGAQRTAGRGRDARRELERSRRETAFLHQDLDDRDEREHQRKQVGTGTDSSVATRRPVTTPRSGVGMLGRWSRRRQPTTAGTRVDSER